MSDPVYMEVIANLYGTAMPSVFVGVGQAMVGTITAFETRDVLTTVLTGIGVVVALVRVLGVFAFRRRVMSQPPLSRTEAVPWERRYAIGSILTAAILGLFAARSLALGNAICTVMAIGTGFGFGAGVVSRLSLRPLVAIIDLAVIGVPVIVMALMRFDVPHTGLALLMTMYVLASFEMVRLSYNASISQITLKLKFEELARLDPMTGVFNRAALAADLPKLLADNNGMVAVHAIDLDRFKEANDRFGHPVGDALLKQVAGRLTSLAASNDLLVRMGGDEFILVQRSLESATDAEALARRIVQSVSARYQVDGHAIDLGVSVGIAVSPDDGRTAEALLSRSDKALYRAKENRGSYVFARDLRAQGPSPDGPALAA